MGTTAQKIARLLQTKLDIKAAIESKGIEVGNIPFSEYAAKILAIGPGPVPTEHYVIPGSGARIDTGVSHSSAGIWFEYDFIPLSGVPNDSTYFGVTSPSNTGIRVDYLVNSSLGYNGFRLQYRTKFNPHDIAFDSRYKIVSPRAGNFRWIINDDQTSILTGTPTSTEYDANFKIGGASDYNGSFKSCIFQKIYRVKIYDGDNLLRDFIPEENDGVVGMRDVKNDVFYAPTNGTFTIGQD